MTGTPHRESSHGSSSDDGTALVEIQRLAPGGEAVGRERGGAHDGRAVFVPLAAPGELVRVRITRERSRVAFGELVAIERPGAVRVEPRCPLFTRCGGCQWQHVSGEAQREAKGAFVSRALGVEAGPALAVGPEYGYRDRARLTVGEVDDSGRRAIGFRAWRSHDVVDVPACPLLGETAARALSAARVRFQDTPAGTQIALQSGVAGEASVAVGGRSFSLEGDELVERPAEAAAHWPVVDAGVVVKAAEAPAVELRPLRVPPGAFAQVGRAANAALLAEVSEALGQGGGRVLELFAGSGNFTRLLVARGARVIASDGDAQSVARGELNVPEAEWRAARTLSPGAAGAAGLEPVDTVVVDPPREGLDPGALALASAARERIVYVSCDPQTLGRDAGRLGKLGFRLERAVALDLMPQTHHVEVVATFVRR